MCWGIEVQTYGIKSLSQCFQKEIYQYVNITWILLRRKHLSLFLILSIKIFKSTYLEEHLQMVASENVFMKLRKIKIYS